MGVKLDCSMNSSYIRILRIPYPVSMGQREESDNDLGKFTGSNLIYIQYIIIEYISYGFKIFFKSLKNKIKHFQAVFRQGCS